MNFNWHNLSDEQKLKERAKVALYAENDEIWKQALKKQCEIDPIFAIEMFFWTYDPSQKNADLPFLLYNFQKNLIRWFENRIEEDEIGLVEKSRQVGVSWVSMTYIFWKWLFAKNFTTICGTRKEEICDKRDSQATLFYKLDYQLSHIPRWLLPRKFSPLKDRRHLILVNSERNNVITGESANPNFARGSTANMIYFDEFSTWSDSAASWISASRASKARICCSTPAPGCFFKTLRFSDAMKSNNRVKTVHWSEHPLYDQKWYEKQKELMSSEAVAQELDISYEASARGRVYEEFDLVDIGKYEYNPKLPLYTASDYGRRDPTSIIWAQVDEKENVYIIDSYENSDKTIDFYIPFYTGQIPANQDHLYTLEEKKQIREHRKWKRARHFGDPAGKAKFQTADLSVIQILTKAGVHVFTNDKAQSFAARREATKMLLRRLFVDEKNTKFIKSIQSARYPQRKETSQATSPVQKPIHDFSSHFRSALEYLAVNLRLGPAPKKINYLKHERNRLDEDGKLKDEVKDKEKKAKILRYSFRSY